MLVSLTVFANGKLARECIIILAAMARAQGFSSAVKLKMTWISGSMGANQLVVEKSRPAGTSNLDCEFGRK